MTVPVRYYCPRCGTIATLQRDAYLDDKSVTPYPLEGWNYAGPEEAFEDADGVRLRCGEHGNQSGTGHDATGNQSGTGHDATGNQSGAGHDATGDQSGAGQDATGEAPCGEPFYLNFVRFEDGEEVEAVAESERVRIGVGPRADGPRVPETSEGSVDDAGPESGIDDTGGT